MSIKNIIADVKANVKNNIADVKADVKNNIADAKADVKNNIADAKADVKNNIADVKAYVDNKIGIDCYAFVGSHSATTQFSIVARCLKDEKFNSLLDMQYSHFEMPGRLSMIAKNAGTELHSVLIEAIELNKTNISQTNSIIEKDYAISYGFCKTAIGLEKSAQSYMYLTDNYSNWMGDLITNQPDLKKKSFQAFVLPGSHDAGMFTGISKDIDLKIAEYYLNKYLKEYKGIVGKNIVENLTASFLIAFAYTQKDNIQTQLKLGIRYFDFRPEYDAYYSDEKLRHKHDVASGYEFDSFLSDVVNFLENNTQEIVVISIRTSISFDKISDKIDEELKQSDIKRGGKDDILLSIEELLSSNKRLIILENGDFFDRYDDIESAYKTDDPDTNTDGDSIIENFNTTLNPVTTSETERKKRKTGCILQLQATYSLVYKDLFTKVSAKVKDIVDTVNTAKTSHSVISSSVLSTIKKDIANIIEDFDSANISTLYPLLYTKAKCDYKTYKWLIQNLCVPNNDPASIGYMGSIILLNDFVDNALVHHAIEATKQRYSSFTDVI